MPTDTSVFYIYLSDPGSGNFAKRKLLRQPADDRLTVGTLQYRILNSTPQV